MSRHFAPSLAMTICVVLASAVLLGLGTWQVQRLFWKQELIARYQNNTATPPVPWAEFEQRLAFDDIAAAEFTRVQLNGTFLHEHELYMTGRSRIGEPGLHVLTPLQLDQGGVIMVNRGWIAVEYRDPATRADGLFSGTVALTGLFRLARPVAGVRAAMLPENDVIQNTWYTLDLPMMANHTGLDLETNYYVMDAREGAPLPYGHQWQLRIHNSHLEYAIIWYTLTLALLGIYIAFGIKRAREKSS